MNTKESLKRRVATYLWAHFPRLWIAYNIRFRKHHFETEYWLIPLFCSSDKISIDVGVNEGNYAHYMSRYSRQVIGFEPNIDLWPHLRRLLTGKVRLESAALSNAAGVAEFRYVEDNTGVATIEAKNALSMIADQTTIKTRPVELRTLDSFALTDVAFIKIDVEGHEEAVIDGAQLTLAGSRPVLMVESEDRHNQGAPQRLATKLAELGYAGFYIKHRRLQPIAMLRKSDTNPLNLAIAGAVYINNFIFIPRTSPTIIERARTAVARM